MVYGVAGKLGGGKSFLCVWTMLRKLREGMGVVSNIKLKEEFLRDNGIDASRYRYVEDFGEIDPWELPHGDLRGSGGTYRVMICVDEAGEWLDSYGDARHKGQLSDVASWLRQSDKLGQDVYFIVQFENLLHTRLRSIVHRWLVCQDLAKAKLPLIGVRLPPVIRNFIVVSEFEGRTNGYLTCQWIPKTKAVFDAYDTAAFFGASFARSSTSKALDYTGEDYRKHWQIPYRELVIFFVAGYLLCAMASYFFFF